MKKFLVFLCGSLLVFGAVGSAGAVQFSGTPSPSLSPTFGILINFDDKSGYVAWNDYVDYGVASITETEGLGSFSRYPSTQSEPWYVGTGRLGERGTDASLGWDGTIRIEFAYLTDKVGIGVANSKSKGGPEFITAYDSDMKQLENYEVPSGLNVYTGIDLGYYGIKYFEITGDFFAIDDLQFNPVPEPATLLLLGFGLIGLAGLGRKKFIRKV